MDKKFLCVGDNISGLCHSGNNRDFYSLIYPQESDAGFELPRYALNRFSMPIPDYLFTGHGGCISFDRAKAERWGGLDGPVDGSLYADSRPAAPQYGDGPALGGVLSLQGSHPARSRRVPFNINITNHEAEARTCTLHFRSVDGVQLSPTTIDLQVDWKHQHRPVRWKQPFRMHFTTHALPIVADVTWNGSTSR